MEGGDIDKACEVEEEEGAPNVLLARGGRLGEEGESADFGRKASPLLGDAGRTGEVGRNLTGESGREVEGEGDCPVPLPRLGDATIRATGAEVEEEEGKMLDGVARIVGDGKRASEAAEVGRVVMLFE